MSAAVETMDCVLIEFSSARLLLPANCILEVLPYAPVLGLEDAPPWVVGNLLWRATTVPLLSPDALWAGDDPQKIRYRRILLLQAPGGNRRLPYYGLLSTDAPHWFGIDRSEVEWADDAAEAQPLGVLGKARIEGETVLIPNLDALEQELVRVLRR
ncbi:MAG: chemotaxis protein CheW [Candidatus Competibacterales bacterium]|nr:chemotaxis protein CheW [Candidatus Competibacterales bacterium]